MAVIREALVYFRAVMDAIPVPESNSITVLEVKSYLFARMYLDKMILESHRCRPSNPPAGNEMTSPIINFILFR